MADRTDPRITRTDQALTRAIVELASQRPVSQITVADLADRAGVTRATFYNRYSSPLELLIQVLYADLDRGHRLEEARRAEGGYSAAQMLRLATGDVADHVERFMAVYQHALHDPADNGVYEALVRHFTDYGLAFISRCTHPDLPDGNHQVIAQFVAYEADIAAYDSAADVTAQRDAISNAFIEDLCAIGKPEDVAAGVARYRAAGATNPMITNIAGTDLRPTLSAAVSA